MKKFLKYFLIMMFLLLTACGKVTEKEARTALSKHLKARYNEEFCIGLIGKRSDGSKTWYEAEIYPKKHRGDRYYYSSGNVNIKKSLFGESIDYVGDIYSLVLLNESANEFYLPKLKELFGENVLPIFNTDVGRLAIKPDFYTTLKESKEENRILELKGGIYIFGRVENDEDREKYREEIYKFLSFMKETGTFEYVKLDFSIIDERIITDEFTAKNLQQEILKIYEKALNNEITGEEFKEKRKKLLSEIKVPYKLNKNKLDEWNKGNIISIDDKLGMASTILFSKIISEKFIASNEYFYKDYPKKSYDKIEDIKLDY